MATAGEWAEGLIGQFEMANSPGTWLHITRKQVADDLRLRLKDPNNINQMNSNTCGVATVVRDWLIDDPVGYVWFAICLFELGYGSFSRGGKSGHVVRPSPEIRATLLNRPGIEDMSAADWIVLASLRNDLNSVLGYRKDEHWLFFSDARAWNFPGDVITLFKRSGYRYVYDYTTGISRDHGGHLESAGRLFDDGHAVVLMIDWRLLTAKDQNTEAVFATSNHFVGLISSVVLDPRRENVKFKVFSWGKPMNVPELGEWMPVKTLERHY